jgi:transcriptional/translational regulatory protein YebC/TACO1
MFKLRGQLIFLKENGATEEKLMETLLEHGVEDISEGEEAFDVTCEPGALEAVKNAADKAGLKYESAEITKLPTTTVKVTGADAPRMLKLVEALEDLDDVQNVYANFDISKEDMEAAAS